MNFALEKTTVKILPVFMDFALEYCFVALNTTGARRFAREAENFRDITSITCIFIQKHAQKLPLRKFFNL